MLRGLRTGQVLRANVAVLAFDHAAQTGEIAFRHFGALAVVAVDFAVAHTVHHPDVVQRVTVRCFIG